MRTLLTRGSLISSQQRFVLQLKDAGVTVAVENTTRPIGTAPSRSLRLILANILNTRSTTSSGQTVHELSSTQDRQNSLYA